MASRLEDVHSTLPAMEKYANYPMHRMHNCLAAIPQARHGMGKKAYWSIKYAAANAKKQKKHFKSKTPGSEAKKKHKFGHAPSKKQKKSKKKAKNMYL